MRKKQTGIQRRRNKWRVYVKVKGQQYATTFPLATPIDEMQDWRAQQVTRYGGEVAPPGGSFADDIATYLTRVAAMPSLAQRAAHLELWAQALGRDRPRRSITAEEIDVVLQTWLTTPNVPAPGQKGRPSGPDGLAPATVRKRRTALQSFFAKMDGKRSTRVNPVKGSDNPPEPKPEARALDYLTIARILAAMPARHSAKPGTDRGASLARLRATVIAFTGLPPGLLMQVQAHDLNFVAGTVRVQPRRKGKGVAARTVPLTPDGVAAFQAFHAANAYGTFSVTALNRCFQRACRRAGLVRPATLYDLRHSFLTLVYAHTRDLATVGRLGLHSAQSRVPARYAMGANAAVDAAAVATVGAALVTERQQAMKAAPAVRPARRRTT